MHDPLTGACSRVTMLDEIAKAISSVDPTHPDALLLYLNVNGFRAVNDKFGHEMGDRLLVEVARRLESVCHNGHLLGRVSGDEFILLVRHAGRFHPLNPMLNRVDRCMSQPFMLGDLEINISVSIGCVIITDKNTTASELMHQGEIAMSLVKRGERKGISLADEEIVREIEAARQIDRKIQHAVKHRGFFLHFQPTVTLKDGTVTGAEALLRLTDENGGVFAASDFMAAIARSEYGDIVDEWVFAEAIHLLRLQGKDLLGRKGFRLSLNVSTPILTSAGYASHFLSKLRTSCLTPESLALELVESPILRNNPILIENLTVLRDAGIMIILDDFGSGDCNFQELARLPINSVKISSTFYAGIQTGNTTEKALLEGIVGIAQKLGYEVIAKGVETQAHAEHLQSLGCRYAQGYHFAKPMPIGEFLDYARNHSPKEAPLP
jgi:diguanylate cyclase (GGDEF)-like protein